MSIDGDSGSWILNREEDRIALLWGGGSEERTSYMMPIEEVARDIEEQTGYILSLPGSADPDV